MRRKGTVVCTKYVLLLFTSYSGKYYPPTRILVWIMVISFCLFRQKSIFRCLEKANHCCSLILDKIYLQYRNKIYFYFFLVDIIYTTHFHIIIWQYIHSPLWHVYIVKELGVGKLKGVKYYALKAYSLLSSVIFVDSLRD